MAHTATFSFFLHAEGHEALGQAIDDIAEFAVGETEIPVGIDHGVLVGMGGNGLVEQLAQGGLFQIVLGHQVLFMRLFGDVQDGIDGGRGVIEGADVMGHDGVVIDAVARLEPMGFLAVDHFHAAFQHDDELLSLVAGKLRRLGGFGQQFHIEGLHVAVGLVPSEGVEFGLDGTVLGPQGAEGTAALGAAHDQGIHAALVVEKCAQPQPQGPGDFHQGPQ